MMKRTRSHRSRDALKVKEDNHSTIEFRITKGLGHSRIYRDPSIIREVLEFF